MIGKSSEIQTVSIYSGAGILSNNINEWLEHNPKVEIIEIKFNTFVMTDEDGMEGSNSEALIIYKEERV